MKTTKVDQKNVIEKENVLEATKEKIKENWFGYYQKKKLKKTG